MSFHAMRRLIPALILTAVLTACAATPPAPVEVPGYGTVEDGGFTIPPVPDGWIPPENRRTTVAYNGPDRPGTIVIDPHVKYLYLVTAEGQADRYRIAVGAEGRGLRSTTYVGRKAEWPTWTPPPEMIKRQPEAAKYAGGMPGGPENPLGARTLYLYQNGRYTLYTIYASAYPETIGTNLTSGCTGLMTQDMIDLYDRTAVKTKVIVLPA